MDNTRIRVVLMLGLGEDFAVISSAKVHTFFGQQIPTKGFGLRACFMC